jgi:hypothetical protein
MKYFILLFTKYVSSTNISSKVENQESDNLLYCYGIKNTDQILKEGFMNIFQFLGSFI